MNRKSREPLTVVPDSVAELDRAQSADERFPLITAADLAQPVPPLEWLVRGVWPKNSYGPMAAASKSLKSYLLLAIAVSVASGRPLFDHFPVEHQGPVLLFVGEGGRMVLSSRLQAIAKRAGVVLEDLPIYAVDSIAAIDDEGFRQQLDERIDELRPSLVAIDPLYAFHPAGIDPANLYERGRMLSSLSGLVNERSALIVVDHFNKSTADTLELNSIAQTGMSQWADSWILMKHASGSAMGAGGEFSLTASFGSRRTSGSGQWNIDWSVPMEEDEFGVHVPTKSADSAGLDWAVRRSSTTSPKQSADASMVDLAAKIIGTVAANEWALTKSKLRKRVGGNHAITAELIDQLTADELLVVEERKVPDKNGRESRYPVYGLTAQGQVLAGGQVSWDVINDSSGSSSDAVVVPEAGTDTDSRSVVVPGAGDG